MTELPPPTVLASFDLDPASIEPIGIGLINRSFYARRRDGTEAVLQRVNPIFPPDIHDDIDAVTRHLAGKGLVTPTLLRTTDGRHHLVAGGEVWRALTRIPGQTHEALGSAAEAREAGRVLGAFHRALADFDAPLATRRPAVHDLTRHLGNLDRALAMHAAHRAAAEVAAMAADITAQAAALATAPELPGRLVHGDPKISNVVFANGRAVCLIDLDTIARMPVTLELGDALRSWCNLSTEDDPDARFSVERFAAALEGYGKGAGGLLTAAESNALPDATLGIALELAARFAADALNESYFGWDRQRFGSASAHNLARAAGQLALAATIRAALPEMRAVVMTKL